MRVADYIMSYLADCKVREIFILPGGGSMYLNDGLACEPRLTPISCHHEQACGIASEANGRTNAAGFGVAIVTSGPGATNILTPVVGAWIESLPLLIISGQVKRADLLDGRHLRQSGVQEVDIISLVNSVTKYSVTIMVAEDIRCCLEEAIWRMKDGRPGPVWLNIPLDVQAEQIKFDNLIGFKPSVLNNSKQNLKSDIDKINVLLSESKRPLLLIGHGVRISGGTEVFRKLIKRLNVPCVFTWNAADLLHWDHDLYVGRPGVVATRAPNFAIQNCDCLIVIGCRLDNIVTAYNPKGFARGAKKIVVDIDDNELLNHKMQIDLAVCADARNFLEVWINSELPSGKWQDWRARCTDWKTRYKAQESRSLSANGVIAHYPFVEILSDLIPENYQIVTGSSGLAIEVFYTVFRNKFGQRLFLTSGLGAMGYGLPAAIGACIGSDRKPTICIESDGSLMLNLQELATLKKLNLPIILIIMNNGGYTSIRNTQRNYFEERYLGTGPEAGLFIPDFINLCKAIGIPGLRIEKDIELKMGLAKALAQNGPFVCEVLLSKNESLSPKVAAIPCADGSIISMPLEDMSPLLPIAELEAQMIVPLLPQSYKARNVVDKLAR